MIEKVIRHYLRVDRAKEVSSGSRKEIRKKIVEDSDVIVKMIFENLTGEGSGFIITHH